MCIHFYKFVILYRKQQGEIKMYIFKYQGKEYFTVLHASTNGGNPTLQVILIGLYQAVKLCFAALGLWNDRSAMLLFTLSSVRWQIHQSDVGVCFGLLQVRGKKKSASK